MAHAQDEVEPRLKIERVMTPVTVWSSCTCLATTERFLLIGTEVGDINIVTFEGDEVAVLKGYHTARVVCITVDRDEDVAVSCSTDGSVVAWSITDRVASGPLKFDLGYPVYCAAPDPRFSKGSKLLFVGGERGELVQASKGFLGSKLEVKHAGEGPIRALQWSGQLVAWANRRAVQVFDTALQRTIRSFEFTSAPSHRPYLFWEGERLLYMTWGSALRIARVDLLPATSPSAPGPGAAVPRYLEVVFEADVGAILCGAAPFGPDILCLTYTPPASSAGPDPSSSVESSQAAPVATEGRAPEDPQVELQVINWDHRVATVDAVDLIGKEYVEPADLNLCPFYPATIAQRSEQYAGRTPVGSISRASPSGQLIRMAQEDGGGTAPSGASGPRWSRWWGDGKVPAYFVGSPKDIVRCRQRDAEDHVAWLLQRGRAREALDVWEAGENLSKSSVVRIVTAFLEEARRNDALGTVAPRLPRLLAQDLGRWELWAKIYVQEQQAVVLAPFLPTEAPRLSTETYRMVLTNICALRDELAWATLLGLCETWPLDLLPLDLPDWIEAAIAQEEKPSREGDAALPASLRPLQLECLLVLYDRRGEIESIPPVLVELGRGEKALDFIERHSLATQLLGQLVGLMALLPDRTASLLVEYASQIPPVQVVGIFKEQVERSKGQDEDKWRRYLHTYLECLQRREPPLAQPFAEDLLELHADFAPGKLIVFLQASQGVSLDRALEIFQRRGLARETVYVLGRMGNQSEALRLILEVIRDVSMAVDFVSQQGDAELWRTLMDRVVASRDPILLGDLLDNIAGHIDPLQVISKIPSGMEVPDLHRRLVKIISNFRSQLALREGCSGILKSDCVILQERLYRERKRGQKVVFDDGD